MKKKWLIFSLLVLVIQTLMPLVTLAEVIQEETKGSEITLLNIVTSEDVITTPKKVGITLNMFSEDVEGTTQDSIISLEGFTLESSEKEDILNNKGNKIGWFKQENSSVTIHTEGSGKNQFSINLNGKLIDEVSLSQQIGASIGTNKVTKKITLLGDDLVSETSDNSEELTAETTTSKEENSEITEDKIIKMSDEKREPINIDSFLNGRAFFKDVELKKQNKPSNDFITINGEKTPVTLEETVHLHMNYSLPEDVRKKMKANDFYEAQLPNELKIMTPITGELASDKTVYATYEVGTTGQIRIIFNNNIETDYDVKGEFFVESILQQGEMKEYGMNVIKFPFAENSPEVSIYLQKNKDNAVNKKGKLNRKNNPTEIDWDVDINLNYGIHNNVVITETFPKETTFKALEVKELIVGIDGSISEGNVISPTEYIVNSNGTEVRFLNKINKPYRLVYKTKIDDNSKPGEKGGWVNYRNQVSMTSSELKNPTTAIADIGAQYKKMLDKKLVQYDPDNQAMSWKIEYNHIESEIKKEQAFLKDVFSGEMILDKSSFQIRKIKFDDNGNQTSEGDLLVEGQDYKLVPTGKGFNVQFLKDINYATTVTYNTLIDEEVHGSDDQHIYNNNVTDGKNNTSGAKGEAYQRVLAKWHTDVNYRTKTVDWHIRLNTNRYEMNNFVLTDKMSTGLKITGSPASVNIRDFTTGYTLIEGEDYLFEYAENSKEFKLSFIGNYAKTSNVFELTYETIFDTPKLHDAGEEQFINIAEGKWQTKDGRTVINSSRSSFEPRPEDQSDGFKHGNYNAKTKGIEWQLGINYNRQNLGDVIIRDELKSNQVYVPDSLKVYRYTITDSGEVVPGKRIVGDELASLVTVTEPTPNQSSITPKDPFAKNELVVKIKNVGIENQYLITFNTSLNNQIVHRSSDYHNVATIQASEVGPDSFKIEGDVSITNGDSFVEKSGYQDNEGFLQWKVTINPSQSTVYKPVITDKPSSNQIIVKESIQLFELDTDERGNFKRGKALDKTLYKIDIETNEITFEQELKITFTDEKIERAYLLEYKSSLFLEKKSGEVATNQVELRGENQTSIQEVKSKKISVRMSSGGGTASGQRGKLFIQKNSDEYGMVTPQPLKGTIFEIFDKKGIKSHGVAETDDNGQAMFDNLPLGEYVLKEVKSSDGFQISEELEKGIPVEVTRLTSTGSEKITLSNERIIEKTVVSAHKEWDDENDQDGLRPLSVDLQLYKNNKKEGSPITLHSGNAWYYEWKNLDKTDKGELIEYEVKEVGTVSGYKLTKEVNDGLGNFSFTNTHTPENVTISGEKTWNDNNNQDGVRPDFVIVNVLQDGQEFLAKKVRPTSDGKWKYEFKNLPKYNKGKEVKYSVTENHVPSYTPKVTGYNIENTHTPGKTNLFVSKAWDDNNDQDGKRAKSIFVQLYGDGIEQGVPIELNEGNQWQHNWVNLDEKSSGSVIHYEVKEITEVLGYTQTINTDHPGNVFITNTHIPEKVTISGEKTWNDNNNQDGVRPDFIIINALQNNREFVSKKVTPSSDGTWKYEFRELDKYYGGQEIKYSVTENDVPDYTAKVTGYDIENTHTLGKTNLFVSKVWDDNNNQDGKRAKSVFVQLYGNGKKQGVPIELNEANQWQHNWIDLDEKASGEIIDYEVKEITEVQGYKQSINKDNPGNVVITNIHTPETVTVAGEKTWNDNDNQDGVRPSEIVVNVLQDGQEFLAKKVKPTSDGKWKYEFKNLPKYNKGQEIKYTVTENTVPNYTPKVTGFNIENTHTPGRKSQFVSKAWDDNNNQDGKRAKTVSVQLYGNNKVLGNPVELNEGNQWQYTWIDLDENESGEEVEYEVRELSQIPGYTQSININNPGNVIITNTHTPEKISISGEKTWNDNNNQDGIRPSEVVINVLQDGQEFLAKKVRPTSEGIWQYEFKELDKYSKGQEIKYSVTENHVSGYTAQVTGYNVENIHTPGKTNLFVSKAWDDENNQDGKRVNSIAVQLYGNNEKYGAPVELNEGNQWQYNWTDLDEKVFGETVDYEVREITEIQGYTQNINRDNPWNVIITNTHTPETVTVAGEKTWNDKDNQDGIRPEFVIVNVLRDGQAFVSKKVKANSEDKWNYEFKGLPKYNKGQEIKYSVTENQVANYTPKVTGYDIENTYIPGKTNLFVSKAWDDENNQDGKRAKSISVQLYRNNERLDEPVELNEGNQWQYNWTNLDEMDSGKAINYEVREISEVQGYSQTVNTSIQGNTIITNTHTPETVTVAGEKTWSDKNNQDGIRPDSIVVNLLANGQEYLSKKVKPTSDDAWIYEFVNLPKYLNGEEITYSVTENRVADYTAEVTGFNIENTHTPGKTNLFVSKAWNDNNNQDGKRAESVFVQLYGNNKKQGDPVELNEGNKWQYNWLDLEEKSFGKNVKYEVKEITEVPGYTQIINMSSPGNVIITNTHIPETVDVFGTKTWIGDEGKENERPEYITINLLKDGQPLDKKEVSENTEKTWNYRFANLPKFENGKKINYAITENQVENYTTSIKGYDVVNTYTPGMVSVTTTKSWNDNQNKAGKRPKSILVQLYKNGIKFGEEVQLSENNNWMTTWGGLPRESKGIPFKYEVKEVTRLTDYEVTINNSNMGNIIITNTYTDKTIVDGGNSSKKNPTTKLLQTGELRESWMLLLGIYFIAMASHMYSRRRREIK